jgi:hypothetical protein
MALLGFLGSAAVARTLVFPVPHIHDEFSYLLAADTFAHGRLTNPPHPFREHFEAPHVLQRPTYMSKYPPAQGVVLALGQRLFGHPAVGVWLAFGLMCGALCFMLQAFVPARWALLGAFLTFLKLGFSEDVLSVIRFGYWAQSYWGGAVAAAGGALLLGSLRRLSRRASRTQAVVFGIALAMLTTSRPYEGFLVALPALIALALVLRRRARRGESPRVVLLALALVLFVLALWILYDDFRVTGHPLLLPYVLYERTHASAPLFVWQSFGPFPLHGRSPLETFDAWTLDYYGKLHGQGLLVNFVRDKFLFISWFFLGPLLVLPAILALFTVRSSRWNRLALATVALFFAGFGLEVWSEPHYAAPIAAPVFLLVVQGLRRLWSLRLWRLRLGAAAVGVAFAGSVLLAARPVTRIWGRRPVGWMTARAKIESELERSGRRHVVFVRYGKHHDPLAEWVYNKADIDGSAVVWAHELGPEKDAALREYFRDRQAWILLSDAWPPQLVIRE